MIRDIRTKDLELEEVLYVGWVVFVRKFWSISHIALIIGFPTNLWLMRTGSIPSIICGFAGWLMAFSFVTQIVEIDLQGFGLSKRVILQRGFSRWGTLFVTVLSKWLTVLFYSILLLVPGVVWFFKYFFTSYAVVLRGLKRQNAFAYSRALVGQNWRKVVWTGFGIWAFYLPFWFVPQAVLTLATIGHSRIFLWGTIPGICVSILFNAYFMVIWTVFFLNQDYLHHPSEFDVQAILTASRKVG